ncbi:Negative elongation factor C/D [Blyttiomyces sp. JEL0837]|nr:Negative elongation factor C/D [Blyttiomyces sp. JEL0837]
MIDSVHDLDAYMQALVEALTRLANSTDVTLTADMADMKQFVLNEQNYLFAKALILRLTQEYHNGKKTGTLLHRISSELDALLGLTSASQPLRDALRFTGKPTTELVTAITKICNREVQSSDIQKLYNAYREPKPPSVEYLRESSFFDSILQDTFGGAGKPNLMDEKLWLLSYASCAVEHEDGTIETNQVEKTVEALRSLSNIIATLTPAMDLKDEFLLLVECSHFPICAAAELNWISRMISEPAFYESNILLTGTENPPLFELLNEIAIHYPLQRNFVLDIIMRNVERAYDTVSPLVAIEIKKRYVDQLIFLQRIGHVVPVLMAVSEKSSSLDDTLLLHFVKQVQLTSRKVSHRLGTTLSGYYCFIAYPATRKYQWGPTEN